MNELFHTEDCGISLVCRCCRGPVCERYLTRSDRMKVQRELWPHTSQTGRSFRMTKAGVYLKYRLGRFALKLFDRKGLRDSTAQ